MQRYVPNNDLTWRRASNTRERVLMSGSAGGRERLTASADGRGLSFYFQDDRCALEAESLPEAINDEALGGKVKRSTLVREEDEGRRPNGSLGDVVDLDRWFDLQ